MIENKIKKNIELEAFDFRFVNVKALIIKVTNKCNLDCAYCYEDVSKKGDILPIETFKNIAKKVFNSSINKEITFIFHGGEPTIIPSNWYSEAILYCHFLSNKFKKSVVFGLQTNLISVTDSKLKELAKLGIKISASIDAFNEQSFSERGLSKKAISNLYRAKALNIDIRYLQPLINQITIHLASLSLFYMTNLT